MRRHSRYDKSFPIEGPDYLRFHVDFDDVDHASVNRDARKAVRILNEHWDDEEQDPSPSPAELEARRVKAERRSPPDSRGWGLGDGPT